MVGAVVAVAGGLALALFCAGYVFFSGWYLVEWVAKPAERHKYQDQRDWRTGAIGVLIANVLGIAIGLGTFAEGLDQLIRSTR